MTTFNIQARSEFHVKRANYIRYVKNAISNTFGKVLIGKIPGNKTSIEAIMNWKTSSNVKWASENLWCQVDENSDNQYDTYINRILNEVFKE